MHGAISSISNFIMTLITFDISSCRCIVYIYALAIALPIGCVRMILVYGHLTGNRAIFSKLFNCLKSVGGGLALAMPSSTERELSRALRNNRRAHSHRILALKSHKMGNNNYVWQHI